jgi:hypothetical protein
MGSIISSINDIIEEHGSWEAFEQKLKEKPVVACIGLPVIANGRRAIIEEIYPNRMIFARLTGAECKGEYVAATSTHFTTIFGAPVIHPSAST